MINKIITMQKNIYSNPELKQRLVKLNELNNKAEVKEYLNQSDNYSLGITLYSLGLIGMNFQEEQEDFTLKPELFEFLKAIDTKELILDNKRYLTNKRTYANNSIVIKPVEKSIFKNYKKIKNSVAYKSKKGKLFVILQEEQNEKTIYKAKEVTTNNFTKRVVREIHENYLNEKRYYPVENYGVILNKSRALCNLPLLFRGE